MSNASYPNREEATLISDDGLNDISAGFTPFELISQKRDQAQRDLDMTLEEYKKIDNKSDPERAKELQAKLAIHTGKLSAFQEALSVLPNPYST